MKKAILIILTMFVVFALFGCKNKTSLETTTINQDIPTSTVEVFEESDNYLVKNNSTEYTIIYPEGCHYYNTFAVNELQLFLKEATGVSFEVKSDNGLTYSDDAKYLSVGQTSVMSEAGLSYDYDKYKESGYHLISKGNSLFLFGGVFGNASAVYDFLNYEFGFEVYAYDEVYIGKTRDDVKLLIFNEHIKPSYNITIAEWATFKANRDAALRMRMQYFYDIFMPVELAGEGMWHNMVGVVDPNIYNDEENHPESFHPEWFNNGQLNLSIDVDAMSDVVVDFWKNHYLKDSESNMGTGHEIAWTFTAMDTGKWSQAESSMQLYEEYGCYSAEYIKFMNVCARKFNQYLKDINSDRKIRYCIFAYQATTEPPVKLNDDGSYVPIDDTVVLEENVKLFYAPLRASFYYSFTEEQSAEFDNILTRWNAVEDSPWLWLYCCNFESLLVPLDFMHRLATDMQWGLNHGSEMIYWEVDGVNVGVSNFNYLYMYMVSKLAQNVNIDVESTINGFFEHYYKDASVIMKKFYDEFRNHFAYLAETTDLTFKYVTESYIAASENWSYTLLMSWLGYIDEAYNTIEHYKDTNASLYKRLKDRIMRESLCVRYLLLRNYSIILDNSSKFAQDLLTDCISVGVTYWTGEKTIDVELNKYIK